MDPFIPIEIKEYEIPTSYTLENKLLTVFLREYAEEHLFSSIEAKKLQLDLAERLFKHFKYAFTKIDVTINEEKTTIEVEYTGGKPLTLEILHTKIDF